MNLWKTDVQPAETVKPTRLRKLYEREPDETPAVTVAHEPAQVSASPDTLEAGSWEQPVAVPSSGDDKPPGDRRKGKRPYARVAKNKVRRHAISISVSEEEEDLLRIHAARLDMSFSAWARQVLFRSLGRKAPARGADE
jgi:hypothetical protein